MSRRRTRNTAPAFSLFSFLDTLMCTMGALILLLVTLSLKIRPDMPVMSLSELTKNKSHNVGSMTEPDPEPAPPAPSASSSSAAEDREREQAERAARRARQREEWARALAEARAARERELATVNQRQEALTDGERKLRKVQARAEQASQRAEAAQQARDALLQAEKKLAGLQEQLAQQIESTRRNLDLEHRKQATASNEYSLVPYDGTSGTMRRPIYIECTRNGYRFLQENVYVGPEHLDGFNESFNPLLTGTQALLRYWNSQRAAGDPEPYVLLIVRPSGCLSYYLARKLLAPLGANFGYELVEEDWKLATGTPDEEARLALRDAIEITVEARVRVRESLAAGGTGRGGGLVPGGGPRALSRADLPEGFNSDRRQRLGSGRGGLAPELIDDPDDLPPGNGNSDRTGSSAGRRSGPGRPYADRPPAGDLGGFEPGPDENETGGRGPGRGRGTGGLGANPAGGRGAFGEPRDDGAAGFGNGAGTGEGIGTADESSSPGRAGNGTGGGKGAGSRTTRAGRPRPATFSGNGLGLSDNDSADEGGDGSGLRPAGRPGRGDAGSAGEEPPLADLPDEVAPPRGHLPRPRSAVGARSQGRLRNLEPDPDDVHAEGGTGGPGTIGEPGGSGDALSGSAGGGTERGGSGSSAGGSAGESGGDISLGSRNSSGERAPPGGKKQWGRAHARTGIGLERKVEIHVKSDHIMIGPNDVTIPVKPGEKTDELAQRLLGGIEQSSQTWGAPPSNFYWMPAAKFVVHPGGGGYYERLRGPLEKAGVSSTVQYAPRSTASQNRGGPRR